MARRSKANSILDVGGGHGQLAIPLCSAGFKVTVLSSADECRKRISGILSSGQCRFDVGNIIALPYADRSFDTSLSFRLLPHCEQWPALIKELCRTATKTVIVDYPTTKSINMIAPLLFGAKKKIEGNTRAWRMFRDAEVIEEFRKNGFEPWIRKKQFFLPMALHRALKCTPISRFLEAVCRLTGLTGMFGSPVIATFRRASLL
jgi:2-polyprenyl-3-methyl-5-hydroxy-6-metoxy-1,4-benzoquinol methylase